MFKYFIKRKEIREFKNQLINEFLKEHKKHIPKFSPNGLEFNWNIFISEEGEYDIFTGEFLGTYEVRISQKPPKYLGVDDIIYKYNTETKQLEKTKLEWSF